jgi:vitamin B12/bleomycin/antimicrobial peptide transport system ATP-binding/permease protein
MSHVSTAQLREAREHLRVMIRHVAVDPRMGTRARLLIMGLVGFMLAINGLNVVNSYVGRDFMTAIADHDGDRFSAEALRLLAVFALLTFASVMSRFCEESMGLLWRKWMTWRLFELYANHQVYLRLDQSNGVENPDQRIAEDVRNFTTTTISFILMLSNGVLTVIAFSGVLISISPLLFAVSIGYATIGTWLTIHFGKPLVKLNYDQLDKEAAFRAALIHIRENGEAIALTRREDLWVGRTWDRLNDLATNFTNIIGVNRNVGFFTTGYNWLIQLIPPLIVAPLFIRGEVEFGVITQSAVAFTQLMGAFSLIITQFQSISSFVAVIGRLSGMTQGVLSAGETKIALKKEITQDFERLDAISLEHLTLGAAKNHHNLIEDLSVTFHHGEHTVIHAVEGAALSALFRAIAGVWPQLNGGKVQRPPLNLCLFVTERPYLPECTLRDLFLRPYPERMDQPEAPVLAAIETPDDIIRGVLEQVGLGHLPHEIGDLETPHDWQSELSLADQQLIVIARVLLSSPRFVLTERLGSSLEPQVLEKTMALLEANDITVIRFEKSLETLTEKPDLSRLEIGEAGSWTWSPQKVTSG